jgi:hypothetical protein
MLAARAAFLIIAEHFTGGLRLPWRAAPADAGAAAALPARMSPSSKGFRRDETSGASSRRGSVALRCATVAASQTASRTEAPPARPRQRCGNESGRRATHRTDGPVSSAAARAATDRGHFVEPERLLGFRREGHAEARGGECSGGWRGRMGTARQLARARGRLGELAECWQYLCPRKDLWPCSDG